MIPFPIVDSHIHFWDPSNLHYDWLAENPKINRSFLPKDLANQSASLDLREIVFVQAGAAYHQALDEVKWVSSLANMEPRIKGIVAHAPLEYGDRACEILDLFAQNRLVKGVRRLIQSESSDFCIQPDFIRGVQLLRKYGYPFDICILGGLHPIQLENAQTLVKACPDVLFVVDHLGKPAVKTQRWQPWAKQISSLAQYPNVWCKLSGLVTEADHHNWTKESLRPYIQHIVDLFSPERCMYGGDWPVSLLATTWEEWAVVLHWALQDLSLDNKEKIFSKNARKFYRI